MHYLSLQGLKNVFSHAAQQPGFCLQNVGHSLQGRAIDLLHFLSPTSKNRSPFRVLLYGAEDATEPTFSQTLKRVLSALMDPHHAIHDLPCEWFFLDCINPDGYLKNEGWYAQPGDLKTFFENAWEDPHTQMIFMNAERPELHALHRAFALSQPDFVFNMHDESHFPADGYKLALSEPVDDAVLKAHFERVALDMDVSISEPIIMDSYGREACFSVSPVLVQKPEAFVFINESCGYRRVGVDTPEEILPAGHSVWKHLLKYQQLLQLHASEELESAAFHVKALLAALERGEVFNAKMLSLTGYDLVYLQQQGVSEAESIKEAFLDYVLQNYGSTYVPVPVERQVEAQWDALFTFLNWKLDRFF